MSRLRSGSLVSASLLAIALVTGACGGGSEGDSGDGDGDGDGADAGSSPQCLEAEDHSDLAWIQEKIFTPGCALSSSCHQGSAGLAADLNLEDGMAETNTVGVPAMSPTAGGIDIIAPGDPENSFLLVILGHYGADDPRIDQEVGTMPFNSPQLCPEKRDAIERWIESL